MDTKHVFSWQSWIGLPMLTCSKVQAPNSSIFSNAQIFESSIMIHVETRQCCLLCSHDGNISVLSSLPWKGRLSSNH